MSQKTPTAGLGIIVAAFSDEDAADQALKEMEKARKQKQLTFDDAAVIKKDPDGVIHVKETGDMSTGRGARIGAVVGGVIGLIGGPAGVIIAAGTGAVIGSFLALSDGGFRNENLEELGESLTPGTAAIVAITGKDDLETARKHISGYDATVTVHELDADITAALHADQTVTDPASLSDASLAA